MSSFLDSNKKEINRFFEWIKSYIQYYNVPVDEDLITNALRIYGLKQNDIQGNVIAKETFINIKDQMFPNWTSYYSNNPNIRCFATHPFFCQFENGSLEEISNQGKYDFIKLYVPLDKEHLQEGVKLIFNYLAERNIKHASKVSDKVRCDDIVIRLSINDKEIAQQLIEFIKNNPYLQEGLNYINPFVPNSNGVGMVIDDDYSNRNHLSYNGLICTYLVNFINSSPVLTADKFEEYLKNIKALSIVTNNLLSPISKDNLPIDKKALLDECLSATLYNYGSNHCMVLLNKFLSGDVTAYNSVSRDFNNSTEQRDYRSKLHSYLSIEDIRRILFSFKKSNNIAQDYVDQLAQSKINAINNISSATVAKYNEQQLKSAINNYIEQNNPNRFTNGESGLRNMLVEKVKYEEVLTYVKLYLQQIGVSCEELTVDQIINSYASEIGKLNRKVR